MAEGVIVLLELGTTDTSVETTDASDMVQS